jgi:hypothetical protein
LVVGAGMVLVLMTGWPLLYCEGSRFESCNPLYYLVWLRIYSILRRFVFGVDESIREMVSRASYPYSITSLATLYINMKSIQYWTSRLQHSSLSESGDYVVA